MAFLFAYSAYNSTESIGRGKECGADWCIPSGAASDVGMSFRIGSLAARSAARCSHGPLLRIFSLKKEQPQVPNSNRPSSLTTITTLPNPAVGES